MIAVPPDHSDWVVAWCHEFWRTNREPPSKRSFVIKAGALSAALRGVGTLTLKSHNLELAVEVNGGFLRSLIPMSSYRIAVNCVQDLSSLEQVTEQILGKDLGASAKPVTHTLLPTIDYPSVLQLPFLLEDFCLTGRENLTFQFWDGRRVLTGVMRRRIEGVSFSWDSSKPDVLATLDRGCLAGISLALPIIGTLKVNLVD